MISPVDDDSLGYLLKRARNQIDPTTGSAYTLDRVGELLGVSKGTIWKWEQNKSVPPPAAINEYVTRFHAPMDQLLKAIGYAVPPNPLTVDEQDHLHWWKMLSRVQRRLMTAQARAVVEELRQLEQ